jgi:hypothetical protein
MAYLQKDDYTISISLENLNEILEQAADQTGFSEDTIRENSELTAQAEITSYLSYKYDVATEFAKAFDVDPDTRNKLILRCVVNCSLYNLHMTINPRDVPEKVEKAYEHCLEMMDAARRGELDPGLDPVDGAKEFIKFGSNVKFVSKPFLDQTIYNDDPTT